MWDPDFQAWVDPLDDFYQNPRNRQPIYSQQPSLSNTPKNLTNQQYSVENTTNSTIIEESKGPELIVVKTEDDAWKIKPDRYGGTWQYFYIEDIGSFAIQYYDADIPETIQRVFTETRKQSVEPIRSPVEEQLFSLQNQLTEIKEMLTKVSKTTNVTATKTSTRNKEKESKVSNDKNSSNSVEVSSGVISEGSSRSES